MSTPVRRVEPPTHIYLQPPEDVDDYEGQLWCEDDDPAGNGEPWTQYTLTEYVLRVIDEEIEKARELLESPLGMPRSVGEIALRLYTDLRSRFAPDTQGGGR